VNQVLREVIAEAVERLADHDERLGLVTVTAVDTTPDLQRAVVYVSSLPEDAAVALVEQRVHLQRVIARQVRMKRTPQLEFEPDPAVAHGWRVEEILRQLPPPGGSPSAIDDSDDGATGDDAEGPGGPDRRSSRS
jgi:ribosome-binding factor A